MCLRRTLSLPLGCRVACGRPPVDMLARKQNTETGYMCKSSKSTGKRDWLTVAMVIKVSLVVMFDFGSRDAMVMNSGDDMVASYCQGLRVCYHRW
jgi:hypothetical protein